MCDVTGRLLGGVGEGRKKSARDEIIPSAFGNARRSVCRGSRVGAAPRRDATRRASNAVSTGPAADLEGCSHPDSSADVCRGRKPSERFVQRQSVPEVSSACDIFIVQIVEKHKPVLMSHYLKFISSEIKI